MESSKKYQTLLLSIGTKKKKKILHFPNWTFHGTPAFPGFQGTRGSEERAEMFFQVSGEAKNSLKCLVSEVESAL